MRKMLCVFSVLVAVILASAFTSMPACADEYDDLSEMVMEANEIKAEIEAAQAEYLAAVQKAAESEREARNAQEELEKIQAELQVQRDKLSQIAVESYKGRNGLAYLEAIFNAGNIFEALRNYEYLDTIAAQRDSVVKEILSLEKQAEELPEKMAEQQRQAEELASAATASKEAFDAELERVKKKMQPYKSAYADRIAGMSGSEQMNEIISYLENVEECTDEQVSIIQSAYRMTGSGGFDGLCESWAETVVRNAGLDMPRYMSAWEDCKANMVSSDMSEVKAGCLIYASGAGAAGELWSHVGIVVYANGNPEDVRICDSVSASGTSQPLEEWLSWQTAVNVETGESGLFGWGYPPGYEW